MDFSLTPAHVWADISAHWCSARILLVLSCPSIFFRIKTPRHKDGSARHYLELVQGRRVADKVRQERLCSLARLGQLQEAGVVAMG